MKKSLSLSILYVFAFSVIGISQSAEMDMIKEIFQMEKKALTSEYLALSGEAETNFWPVYDAYEAERQAIGQRRINLLKDYADKYETVTDEQASAMVKESLDIQKKTLALRKKYFKKTSKVIGAKAATSFYQLEEYIATAIKFDILDTIPFVND